MEHSYFELFEKSKTHRLTEEEKHYTFPYPLDDFQEEGMYRIHHEENILVTAHTGSGKTTFALYAIAQAFARKQKVVYTSPIKSLSNQKYAEFKKIYGAENVGILTGDIKMNPNATCVIMTTEVLRNMLYKTDEESQAYLQQLGLVIFDEVHYINDKDRGKVWEEVIILLPKHVLLIMLSATIEGAPEFAQWVGKIKERNTVLIPTSHRVVPLQHYLYDYQKGMEYQAFRNQRREKQKEARKNGILTEEEEQEQDDSELFEFPWKLVMSSSNEMVPVEMIRKEYKKHSTLEILQNVVTSLHYLKKTPALFFVFSRKECEYLAKQVTINLVDHNTRRSIIDTFHHYMHPYKTIYEKLPQYDEIYNLIQCGVAYHHSGMIPILKEIVEVLFGLGYIKILFATETFAVGVNMPTKTVLFPSLKKYDNEGLRYLNHAEYMQMSVRAGRLGLDKVGNVILLPCMDLPSDAEWKDILSGKSPRVSSKFVPTYQFVLKNLYQEEEKEGKLSEREEYPESSSDSKNRKEIQHASRQLQSFLKNTYFMDAHEKTAIEKMRSIQRLQEQYQQEEALLPKVSNEDLASYQKIQEKLSGSMLGVGFFVSLKPKDKIKLERELDTLRKKYSNPSLEERIQKYNTWQTLGREMKKIEEDVKCTSTFLFQNILHMKALMKDHGYLDGSEHLTKRGLIGMHINECNELLFAYMLERYMEDPSITFAEWIGLFSLFIEGKEERRELSELHISPQMRQIIQELENEAIHLANEELQYEIYIGTKYELNYEFVEVLYEWAQGHSYESILQHHSIFDGNFVKAVLRVQNIVEDVKNICKMTENYVLLQRFENSEVALLRDIAQINSLYIKMV